ncbi:flagellar basal-body rod modification protein FlgD [Nocardioides exalbidus]|uniref:Flagellar basal-body rod modification protein FlgD n=1 Tax=Nocardioides exalbidus TaxID=402596 RepID=A0A1H4N1Z9_9ACTN|nr:flagellar hook capping FlgD N-terminal domain-containing protein [Nocardioides exalbidus]SEB89326.1 flagellar basal-body rod modification protein FlgD [Nocardioides exalbidus]
MTISANEPVTGTPSAFPTGTTTLSSTSEDKQMFLELMVAQLRYQDPLNPADSGEFLAQSAQFTALEKMQDVSDRVGALLGSQMAFGAGAMVGQQVSWVDTDGTTTHNGTISGVTFGAQGPVFEIDGTQVPLAQLLSVGTTTPAPTTPTTPAA